MIWAEFTLEDENAWTLNFDIVKEDEPLTNEIWDQLTAQQIGWA